MRKITIDLNSYSKYTIFENTVRQGENLATEVEFKLSPEFTGYKYLMMFQLNNKSPVPTSELVPIDNKVSYVITNAVTNEPGTLRVELHAYDLDTDALIKTAYVNVKVAQSLNGKTEVMPEAYVPWYIDTLEQVNIAKQQAEIATTKAQEAAQSASDASGSPKGVYDTKADLETAFPIGNNFIYLVRVDNNWYYWNGTAWTPGGVYQSATLAADKAQITDQGNFYNSGNVEGALQEIGTELSNIKTELSIGKIKKYGVKFTGSNPVGERLYDAVGMKAPVAVDNQIVDNDFDKVGFYDRPMCNVYFTSSGHPNVMAYRGEPGFNFEGAIFPPYAKKASVYYECKPCGWNGSYDEPTVTGTPSEGFELFSCFPNWNTKIYLPTFWMAYDDGQPVSISGTRPGYYSLNSAMSEAKAWNANAHTETMAAHMYEYVLQLVEFATRDVQNVMMGCSNLRYNSATDTAVVAENEVNRIILLNSAASNYVAGQTIVIGTSQNDSNVAAERSITSIETYDADNKAIYFDGAPVNITIGNFVSSRVWKNGATDIVVASSGSPVSNTSGKYPFIWRGKVDAWAQGFSGLCDILIERNGAGTVESPYTYRPYFLPDPKKYANGVITNDYIELQYDLPQTDGYVKSLWQDTRHRHIGLTQEIGAGSTTWLSAYYYYPRYDVCVVFVGGDFINGRNCSPVCFHCYVLPSGSNILRLARLFVTRV